MNVNVHVCSCYLQVGLAVGDVKEIQEKAKLWRTVLQVGTDHTQTPKSR